jgi:hypothetical protein
MAVSRAGFFRQKSGKALSSIGKIINQTYGFIFYTTSTLYSKLPADRCLSKNNKKISFYSAPDKKNYLTLLPALIYTI